METPFLSGIRIQLSGSMPDPGASAKNSAIREFVMRFTQAVLREGGTIVHGSHPTFLEPLIESVLPFVQARGGPVEALTLVRSEKYSKTPEQTAEIEEHRKYSVVQIIPAAPGNPNENLVPMRGWMAERCDVIVAVGGKWYDLDKSRAGVPAELEEMLLRGRPGFVAAAFGGAAGQYWNDDDSLKSRLQNGLSSEANDALGKCNNIEKIVSLIVDQIKLLPLKRKTVSSGRMFRILALDGGGIRGTFTAAVLAPSGIIWEGKALQLTKATSTADLYMAVSPGLCTTSSSSPQVLGARVRRADYVGKSAFRHLEEED